MTNQDKTAVKKVPRVLRQFSRKDTESPSLWGKGTGGGYPWRKK